MTNTSSVDSIARGPIKRPFRPSLVSDVVMGAVVIGAALEGSGRSPIQGFIPFAISVAVIAVILDAVREWRSRSAGEPAAESPKTATLRALLWGISVGVAVSIIVYLGWRDTQLWGGAAVIAVLAGVRRYWFGRKLPHPQRVTFIIAGILFVVLVMIPAIVRRVS